MSTAEGRISVSGTIEAAAEDVFAVLTNPDRHREFDGSDMIRSDENAQPVRAVGDVFTMNMHAEIMGGDYQTHNHVSAYLENRMLAWRTASGDAPDQPGQWEWIWMLEPIDDHSTKVTHVYDWSAVENEQLRAMLPAVTEEQMTESLNKLAAAVTG